MKASLEQLDFTGINVLVVGDIMLDRYLIGKVDRPSPEANVPVLLQTEMDERLGGAANVALNVKNLGAKVSICGLVGLDESGNTIHQLLNKFGINDELVFHKAGRMTTTKTRVMKNREHLLRVDKEVSHDIDPESANMLAKSIMAAHLLRPFHIIILQDYNKGIFTQELIGTLLDFAKTHGIQLSVDPKRKHFFSYTGVDLFKPNLKELCEAYEENAIFEEEKVRRLANKLRSRIKAENLLVTLSENGSFYANGQSSGIVSAKTVDSPDVCGAGDGVIALASLLLYNGVPLYAITELVNIAGSIICRQAGVATLDHESIVKSYFQ